MHHAPLKRMKERVGNVKRRNSQRKQGEEHLMFHKSEIKAGSEKQWQTTGV